MSSEAICMLTVVVFVCLSCLGSSGPLAAGIGTRETEACRLGTETTVSDLYLPIPETALEHPLHSGALVHVRPWDDS
jgi:hypothetical protein